MASNSTTLYSSNYPSSSPYTLTATIVENSHSDANNTSNVTITATITSGGVYYSGYSTPVLAVYLKDNGSNTAYTAKASEQISSITSGTPSRSVTWTGDMTHKSDGTLTATVKAAWEYKASGTGYAPVSGDVECALVLTTCARAGSVSISPTSKTISTSSGATQFTITATPASSSFYHRISATCSGTSVMTAVWAEDVSNTATITDQSLLTALGDNTSGTVTVTLQTYATKSTSGTLIGTKTASASVTVDTSVIKPTLSSVSIAIKTTPITSYLVAGYSAANVKFTPAVGYGATSITTTVSLSKGTMATSSATGTGAKTLATNTLPSSTSDYTLTATIKATDGRGATATATATYTVKGYTVPAISASTKRVASSSSTAEDEAGTYAYITYSATAKSIGNNSIQSLTATYSGSISGTLSGSPSWVALAENQSITILITATDRVASATLSVVVPMAMFPLDIYQSGSTGGIGFGTVATAANRVQSAWDMFVEKSDATAAYFRAENTLGSVDLRISPYGDSGVYSTTNGHWIMYDDTNGHTHLPAYQGDSAFVLNSSSFSSLDDFVQKLYDNRLRAGAVLFNNANQYITPLAIEWYHCYFVFQSAPAASGDVRLHLHCWGQSSLVVTHILITGNNTSGYSINSYERNAYTAGDILTEQDMPFASGWVTSSQTELALFFPLAKPLLGVSGATLNSATFTIRTAAGGYLQYYNGSTYTQMFNVPMQYDSVSFRYRTGGILIYFTCSNKWGLNSSAVTNNSLVSLAAGSLSITLS